MNIPTIAGTIDRRILVNYRVDPPYLQRLLPGPFRPRCIHGMGIAGICLIRLKQLRPRSLPTLLGLSSENAAHRIAVEAHVTSQLPENSIFASLEEVSTFFEQGSLGYSVTREAGRLDSLELRCFNWKVEPLQVTKAESSFFDDQQRFPPGSAELDCALLMRAIRHEWYVRDPFHTTESLVEAKSI